MSAQCTNWKTKPVKLAAFSSHDVHTSNTTFYKGPLKPWSNSTQEVDMFQHCAIASESTDVRHLSLNCKLGESSNRSWWLRCTKLLE